MANVYAPFLSVLTGATGVPSTSETSLPSGPTSVRVTPSMPGSPSSCKPFLFSSNQTKSPTETFGAGPDAACQGSESSTGVCEATETAATFALSACVLFAPIGSSVPWHSNDAFRGKTHVPKSIRPCASALRGVPSTTHWTSFSAGPSVVVSVTVTFVRSSMPTLVTVNLTVAPWPAARERPGAESRSPAGRLFGSKSGSPETSGSPEPFHWTPSQSPSYFSMSMAGTVMPDPSPPPSSNLRYLASPRVFLPVS